MAAATQKRPPIAVGVLLLLLFGTVVFVGIVAAVLTQNDCGEGGGGPVGTTKGVPKQFAPIYAAAAKKYDLGEKGPAILASIHKTETGFGRLNGTTSGAGAQGHMQFMPATWASYGVDADGDGSRDQYDPKDAIHGAANYLKASGAPKDWRRAIFAYNHADWYVDQILDDARRFQGSGAVAAGDDAAAAACPGAVAAGNLSGTPKEIIDRQVIPLAKKNKMEQGDTVKEVEEANAAHGPTVSGSRSDHQGPPDQAWAADMSNGSSPTPEMDALAEDLAKAFKLKWSGSGVASTTHKGYRVQMIYRSHVGGNHFNHVHFGVRKGGESLLRSPRRRRRRGAPRRRLGLLVREPAAASSSGARPRPDAPRLRRARRRRPLAAGDRRRPAHDRAAPGATGWPARARLRRRRFAAGRTRRPPPSLSGLGPRAVRGTRVRPSAAHELGALIPPRARATGPPAQTPYAVERPPAAELLHLPWH